MLHDWVEGLLSSVPAQCAVCRAWPAQPVCEACVERFAQPRPRCRTCALQVPAGVDQCGRCLLEPPQVERCLAAVSYAYPWAGLITQFKFHGQPGWAGVLATLMRSAPWVEPVLEQADLVLPMPLARERLALRGFNQALQLARALAPSKVRADLLLRLRDTPSQAELSLAARRVNVQGAFSVDPLQVAAVYGLRLVLVDDVMTSGASLDAAAKALRHAGADAISAIVLARTEQPQWSAPQ